MPRKKSYLRACDCTEAVSKSFFLTICPINLWRLIALFQGSHRIQVCTFDHKNNRFYLCMMTYIQLFFHRLPFHRQHPKPCVLPKQLGQEQPITFFGKESGRFFKWSYPTALKFSRAKWQTIKTALMKVLANVLIDGARSTSPSHYYSGIALAETVFERNRFVNL